MLTILIYAVAASFFGNMIKMELDRQAERRYGKQTENYRDFINHWEP